MTEKGFLIKNTSIFRKMSFKAINLLQKTTLNKHLKFI